MFRAAAGYGLVAFGILQIIEPIMHGLHWPDEVLSYTVVLLALGFPLIVSLAWAFDVRADETPRRPLRVSLPLVAFGAVLLSATLALFFLRGRGARAAAGRDQPSIAVLPFADMSAARDQEYFSDGIAEEILNALTQVEGLRVTGRVSSFSFKGKDEDLRRIAEKLGVAHVLEGSVRKSGNRVRVTSQLIEAAGGSQIWSQSYDRELTDILAVESEIATAVVEALKLKLLQQTRPAHVPRPEVYDLYLLARQEMARGSRASNRRAVENYRKALELDPGYAPAWAGLARGESNYVNTFAEGLDDALAAIERASADAEKALLLAPDLPDAWVTRGQLRNWYGHDFAGARSDLSRALALNGGRASIIAAWASLLASLGRLDEAIATYRKALDLDPLDSFTWTWLASAYQGSGDLKAARAAFDRALQIEPEFALAACLRGSNSLLEGHPDQALAEAEKCAVPYLRLAWIVCARAARHEPLLAEEALKALTARYAGVAAFQIAQAQTCLSQNAQALDWLDRAWQQRDPGLSILVAYDPFLKPLREEPRFRALLARLGLQPR